MRLKNMIKFFGAVAIIIGVFATCIRPLAESIKQGLDLQGGTHIVLEAQDTPTRQLRMIPLTAPLLSLNAVLTKWA